MIYNDDDNDDDDVGKGLSASLFKRPVGCLSALLFKRCFLQGFYFYAI